jgi:hypothetical protein
MAFLLSRQTGLLVNIDFVAVSQFFLHIQLQGWTVNVYSLAGAMHSMSKAAPDALPLKSIHRKCPLYLKLPSLPVAHGPVLPRYQAPETSSLKTSVQRTKSCC